MRQQVLVPGLGGQNVAAACGRRAGASKGRRPVSARPLPVRPFADYAGASREVPAKLTAGRFFIYKPRQMYLAAAFAAFLHCPLGK